MPGSGRGVGLAELLASAARLPEPQEHSEGYWAQSGAGFMAVDRQEKGRAFWGGDTDRALKGTLKGAVADFLTLS